MGPKSPPACWPHPPLAVGVTEKTLMGQWAPLHPHGVGVGGLAVAHPLTSPATASARLPSCTAAGHNALTRQGDHLLDQQTCVLAGPAEPSLPMRWTAAQRPVHPGSWWGAEPQPPTPQSPSDPLQPLPRLELRALV